MHVEKIEFMRFEFVWPEYTKKVRWPSTYLVNASFARKIYLFPDGVVGNGPAKSTQKVSVNVKPFTMNTPHGLWLCCYRLDRRPFCKPYCIMLMRASNTLPNLFSDPL